MLESYLDADRVVDPHPARTTERVRDLDDHLKSPDSTRLGYFVKPKRGEVDEGALEAGLVSVQLAPDHLAPAPRACAPLHLESKFADPFCDLIHFSGHMVPNL